MKLIRTKGRGAKEAAAMLAALERRGGAALDTVMPAVKRIVRDVRKQGDRALLRYAKQFDGLSSSANLRVTQDEMAEAWAAIDPALRDALSTAAHHIREFAKRQQPESWKESPDAGPDHRSACAPHRFGGLLCAQRAPSFAIYTLDDCNSRAGSWRRSASLSRPLSRLPRRWPQPACWASKSSIGSAALMPLPLWHTEPKASRGSIRSSDRAISTSPQPSAWWHSIAPSICSAGPTEIVVASERGDAAFIASDLVAQAEHDPEALAIFVTTRADLAKEVIAETNQFSRGNTVARQALDRNGLVVIAAGVDEAHEITNRLAPEHLTVDEASDLKWVRNAGSVFVGRWSAQPMGDYISGPNHTLPTGGMARVRGGLSVNDFVKLITVQEYSSKRPARTWGRRPCLLAEAEGLVGHAEAIRSRLGKRRSRA